MITKNEFIQKIKEISLLEEIRENEAREVVRFLKNYNNTKELVLLEDLDN